MEHWAEIRRLRRVEGMAISAIARRLGIAGNTVKRALAADSPPRHVRAARGSIVDAVEPAIRELLRQTPDMSATVVGERIGWDRSITVLKDRIRVLARTICQSIRRPGRATTRGSGCSVTCGSHPRAYRSGSGTSTTLRCW